MHISGNYHTRQFQKTPTRNYKRTLGKWGFSLFLISRNCRVIIQSCDLWIPHISTMVKCNLNWLLMALLRSQAPFLTIFPFEVIGYNSLFWKWCYSMFINLEKLAISIIVIFYNFISSGFFDRLMFQGFLYDVFKFGLYIFWNGLSWKGGLSLWKSMNLSNSLKFILVGLRHTHIYMYVIYRLYIDS